MSAWIAGTEDLFEGKEEFLYLMPISHRSSDLAMCSPLSLAAEHLICVKYGLCRIWFVGILLVLVGCGGSGGDPQLSLNDFPEVTGFSVWVDDRLFRQYEDISAIEPIDSEDIVLAETWVRLRLTFSMPADEVVCSLANQPLALVSANSYEIAVQAAYFQEKLTLQCMLDDTIIADETISIYARDPVLQAYFDGYLESQVAVAKPIDSSDPYSGYRQKNYYSKINYFFSLAELYSAPELYGISVGDPVFVELEKVLLNTAEAFFEPCLDYDPYTTIEARQCRSVERVGSYYIWRSPTAKDSIRLNHAKVEWRAAAGIAQAIKAVLLRNPGESTDICPTADEPSTIRSAPISCRALNVRRLLYEQVWLKWNDFDRISSVGVPSSLAISTTLIPHYIAWTEFIYDLFAMTASIDTQYECVDCVAPIVASSRRDFLLEFFNYYGENDEYVGHYPKHPNYPGSGGLWEGYELDASGSAEISHSNTTYHYLSMYSNEEACSSSSDYCISFSAAARAMNDVAWVDWIENDGFAVGFPKFDVFVNGYCGRFYADPSDSLQQFCEDFWVTEAEAWLPHRRLIGFVNLGKFNRDLMIKLRKSFDENRDGLLDSADKNGSTYIVFLYKQLVNIESGT